MREYLKENVIPVFFDKVKEYSVKEIENAIVNAYLGVDSESYVKKVIEDEDINVDVEMLTYLFEGLLEADDVNENGIVFTPEYIAHFICKGVMGHLREWKEEYKIMDPGCGCGIFLVAAVVYINKKFAIPVDQIIKNNIYGMDIIEDNVIRCKKILKALAKKNDCDLKEEDINIFCEDSLKIDWSDVLKVSKFDFIVGNPPYVNTHDMSKDTAVFLKKNFYTTQNGVYNIFYAFIEKSMNYLSKEGKLSFIVPNNFLTIKSATNLRDYLQKQRYLVSILDFSDNMIFKPVRTYNCIILLDKNDNINFKYSVMDKVDDVEKQLEKTKYEVMPISRLDKAGWKLVDHKTYENLVKIEKQGRPIKEFIRTGIATLRDLIFMVEKKNGCYFKESNGVRYEIEGEIVKKIYKIPELKNCNNLDDVCRYIIFPYAQGEEGYRIINETLFQEKYPNAYKYLLSVKDKLDERDKGKPNPVAWYAYGRSQGLNKYGKKLLFPTFADNPNFLYVDDENALFCNGYGIFENDYLELEALKAVLNSRLMKYYVSNTSYSIEGGYYCYQKKYIERFGLPVFSEAEKNILFSGDRKKIDEMLFRKYSITI